MEPHGTHTKPIDWICSALNLDLTNTQLSEDWVKSSSNITLRRTEKPQNQPLPRTPGSIRHEIKYLEDPRDKSNLQEILLFLLQLLPDIPTTMICKNWCRQRSVHLLTMTKTHSLSRWSFSQAHCEKQPWWLKVSCLPCQWLPPA